MIRKLLATTALATLVASGALAQEAETDEAAPTEAAATDEGASATPADPTQNWLKVCDPLDDGKKACIMRQVIVANNQFLGSFLLRDDPGQESRLLAVAAVPVVAGPGGRGSADPEVDPAVGGEQA